MERGLTPKERFNYMVSLRNFHYDNFNKWMTYFYVATGAMFIGYYTLLSSTRIEELKFEVLTISFLGYVTSLFWYWSGKGYYYWVTNFINLLNYYENEVFKLEEGDRVFSVFYNKRLNNDYCNPLKGANISTSKVTLLFSFIVALIWGGIFFRNILESYHCCLFNFNNNFCEVGFCDFLKLFFIVLIITIVLSSCIPKKWLLSHIDEHAEIKKDK